MVQRRAVIVGGGAAGAWLAWMLAARGVHGIDIVDPGDLGRGLAYSAPSPAHLLNVPAHRMDMATAPGEPMFADWLVRSRPGATREDYVPRWRYGDFLGELMSGLQASGALRHRRTRATAVSRDGDRFQVSLADGGAIDAPAVVLAVGNLAPVRLAPGVAHERILENPWALPQGPARDAGDVLVAGTGLTALDAVAAIASASPSARFVLAARRPYVPPIDHVDETCPGLERLVGLPPSLVWREAMATIRARGAPDGWKGVVDSMKKLTEPVWLRWTPRQRASFMRHGVRHWLQHRHRAPPPTSRLVDRLRSEGRLLVKAGRVTDLVPGPSGVSARVGGEAMTVDLVVNATGPSLDIRRHDLLARLLEAGLLARCPLGLGIDVDARSLSRAAGGPVPGLYVLGPLTRGAFFEVVAVPHFQGKARAIADAIACGAQAGSTPAALPSKASAL